MHELSLAQGILEVVEDVVAPERRGDVREVHVQVGRQAAVVVPSLEFCFTALIHETELARAHLCVERTAGHDLRVSWLDLAEPVAEQT